MGTNPKPVAPVPQICTDCVWFSLHLRIARRRAEFLEEGCVEFLVDVGAIPSALLCQTALAALAFQNAREDQWNHQHFGHRET